MRTIIYSVFYTCLLFSCKKEDTIQPTPTNKAPVARAGQDTTIYIPETSYTLDGKDSFDPDGEDIKFSWRQISGPQLHFFQLNNNQTTATLSVRGEGSYEFELKVTDPSGLSAQDTVLLNVVDNFAVGKAPVVSLICNSQMLPSHIDQIELSANAYVESDQGQRFDIRSGFSAKQISGPSAALIHEAYLDHEHIAIPINDLIKGTYQFQVEVTRKGIIAYDTAIIQVVDDTLKGKEFIFETQWKVDGYNTVSAKMPERQDIFYMSRYRDMEVLVLFEDDPNWYAASEGWDWESWLFYSTNACNSTIEVIINDDLASYMIGRKTKIKVRYL
jgi:hypothetical protein